MKSIKISFIENESKIIYEDYYFNGIPIPKDIEFQEVGAKVSKSYGILMKLILIY